MVVCKQFERSNIACLMKGRNSICHIHYFIHHHPPTHLTTRESNPFVKLDTLGASVAPSCHMATPTLILALTSFS